MTDTAKRLRKIFGNTGVPVQLYPTGKALVDPEDWEKVFPYHWLLQKDSAGLYANRKASVKGRTRYFRLQRIVTNCSPEQSVHAKNGNNLDCRKHNLAVYTYTKNRKGL